MSETNGGGPSGETLNRKLTRHWAGLRMAHEATMLEDLRGLMTKQRERIDTYQRQMTGIQPTKEVKPMPEDDDGIHVGDKVENHYHAAKEKAEAVATKAVGWMDSPLGSAVGKALGISVPAAGLVYLGTLLTGQQQPATPTTPVKPAGVKPLELELRWKVIDGKVSTEVVPVEPTK